MADATDVLLKQIDEVLHRLGLGPGEQATYEGLKRKTGGADSAVAAACVSVAASIERLTPPGSHYRKAMDQIFARYHDPHVLENLEGLVGLLSAVRADLQAGYFKTVAELLHADLFGDFLEMGKELLDKGFKDPAAVVAGSVLEEHLRKLCEKAGVDVAKPDGSWRNADALNADLAKAGVYGTLEQKAVTAWLALRNHAAHGRYGEYDHPLVAQLLDGIRGFLIRHPA